MREFIKIIESLGDWNTEKWVHYSDYDTMKIHPTPGHNDPVGIYLFPEKFQPINFWAKKKFKFLVSVKSGSNILDYSMISDKQIDELLTRANVKDQFDELNKQYPIENRKDMLKRAWDCMRGVFSRNGSIKWNKLLREFGWDAIFDDTRSIHIGEVQLLVLNPRIIQSVTRVSTTRSGWKEMHKVIEDMKNICSKYGNVEIEGPKTTTERYSTSKILLAKIQVHKSEENYADFQIKYDPNDSNRKDKIEIHLRWSRPSLDYGVGSSFDIYRNEYKKYSGLDNITSALDKVFFQTDVKESDSSDPLV